MNHAAAAFIFLAIMVLFLVGISAVQLLHIRSLALRISYLEGTSDMILQSQEQLNKLVIAFMENQR